MRTTCKDQQLPVEGKCTEYCDFANIFKRRSTIDEIQRSFDLVFYMFCLFLWYRKNITSILDQTRKI